MEKLFVVTKGYVNAGKFMAYKYATLGELLVAHDMVLPRVAAEIAYTKTDRQVRRIVDLNDATSLSRFWTTQQATANIVVGQELPNWIDI